jgi:integrase
MEHLDITKIVGKNTPNERVYLTADELRKLIATKCKREDVRNAFLFCCMCGLRWSDVSTLKWEDIHADGDEWKIEKRMIKTSELLYLPLSKEAKNYLPSKELKESSELVFTLPTLWATERIITDWVKEAKITKHVTFHCARHTFATMMLTQGADLYTTSKLLGHTSVKTTEIYAKIVDQKKVEAVNLLNGLLTAKND